MKRVLLSLLLLVALGQVARAQAPATPPVLVTLWFDEEDYILPQDDDATKRLAEILTRLGVRATFKIVGEKARVLEQRGRKDVLAALQPHEIGYHSNTHSQQPTPAVYLQHAGWLDGTSEFLRREGQGAKDVARITGRQPVAYGQPGSSWGPQSYPALRAMGIHLYLDEADHVGIDDQPFYYGGMLNVFKMRSTLARMELTGGSSLDDGKATFTKAADIVRARGGGTVSIFYHPSEWVHTEFWDGVNFSHGANPPRSEWKKPGLRPVSETEQAFADFEAYVRFIQAQPGVRFVTASELVTAYADQAMRRGYSHDELRDIAQAVQKEESFQIKDGYAISAADAFVLLTGALGTYAEIGAIPQASRLVAVDGPGKAFEPSAGPATPSEIPWEQFVRTTQDVRRFLTRNGRVPDEVWVGASSLSPADYLATLGGVVERLLTDSHPPVIVQRRTGTFTADHYVATDSQDLWGWVIFPDGFHAPELMALARLQAWTLKPALLAVHRSP